MLRKTLSFLFALAICSPVALAQNLSSETLNGLQLRNIGPADVLLDQPRMAVIVLDHHDFDGCGHDRLPFSEM